MNTPYFKHQNALVESHKIGKNTRVWAFAHILPGAVIGEDCNICDGVFIENDVSIGDRVTIKCGVQIWDGINIENDVFIGPNATFTNDRFPRSRQYPTEFLKTVLEKNCSIGANSTILPGITIGAFSMVGAGAVVTKDVPPYSIVVGNPARIVGQVEGAPSSIAQKVTFEHRQHIDNRGHLFVGEFLKDIPFLPKRFFTISNVPKAHNVRGEHAHLKCKQYLICMAGEVDVLLDDGKNKKMYTLNSLQQGLYIAPKVWGVQTFKTESSVLLVFASEYYEESDYIRDYQKFKNLAGDRAH